MKTHTAPNVLLSADPPITAVLPSADNAILQPKRALPIISMGVSWTDVAICSSLFVLSNGKSDRCKKIRSVRLHLGRKKGAGALETMHPAAPAFLAIAASRCCCD